MALRAAALLLTVLLAALLIRDVDAAVNKPKLKWKHGGCLVTYAVWCDYGWYSSPYAGDINGDGKVDVIGSPGDIYRLKRNGATVWEHEVSGRTWPSVCVADLDKDGQEEIITAHGDGSIEVLRPNGASKNGWPQSVKDGREIRSLKVADLDNDGFSEVIVGTTAADEQVYVFRHDGQKKWSQTSGDGAANGYNHGIYSDSIGIYGKKKKTIIAPSDTHYIHAYKPNGDFVSINKKKFTATSQTHWGNTGVWIDNSDELQGWAPDGHLRVNYASGCTSVGDLDGDGKEEIVVAGSTYPAGGSSVDDVQYEAVHIFKKDRTRWKANGYDWRSIPSKPGAPLVNIGDYHIIESPMPNTVLADIDHNGELEIILTSWDGKVHVYWLNQKEKYNWPYVVGTQSDPRYAAEPVVADLDNDGKAEVILCTWPRKGNNRVGHLIILDYKGNELRKVSLPAPDVQGDYNGCLAGPTLANLDNDDDLEIVLNTVNSGIVAYDLPNTAKAKILWKTARFDFGRTGRTTKNKCGKALVKKYNSISKISKRQKKCKSIGCKWVKSKNKCKIPKKY